MKGSPADFQRGTVAGTRNVIDACLKHRVERVVYVSSVSVLDHAGSHAGKVTEAWPLEPHAELRGAYTQTKLEAERMVMAAANVRYRDVRHAVPFLIQIWMFATPIIYPVSMIPQRFRPILALNPCWGMVNAFRACVFPGLPFDFRLIGTSIGVALVVFLSGAYYFYKAEKSFADVI